jgi:predicted CXXCH cytochrome family protein
MNRRIVLRIACVVSTVAAAAATAARTAGWQGRPQAQTAPVHAGPSNDQTLVGAARCAECHASVHRTWSGARHSKMLQPATPATVLGDFSQPAVTLRGSRFEFQRQGDRFVVRGPFPTVKPETHRIDYTLGSRRVQHYLTTLADGRIVVLPPTWDVERREWFHNLDIVNPDEAVGVNPVQVWNSNCFGCHVSAESKGFDAARQRYDTRWMDFGTSCERCHGPGGEHSVLKEAAAIVVPTRLSPERSTMVCAQCHSLRDITVPGFTAGADYFDHFTPVLEYGQKPGKDPAYWPDGRPRRFSNDAIGFWQSRCFLDGGATCTTCHTDPHEPDIDRNPQLRPANEALCTTCHQAIAANVTRHTRHAPASAGSSCIACHMPRTVVSLRSRMPDHTISVPAPENTVRHGIPNACSECHQEKTAAWAVETLAQWFPNGRRQQLVARADAFTAARRREPAAIDRLLVISRDRRQPPLTRANAVGYLRLFPGAPADAALAEAARDPHPAVRAAALLGLAEPGFFSVRAKPLFVEALADPRRIVRISGALSLINLQVTQLPGRAGDEFEAAKRDYLSRASLLADDAGVLLDAGKFHLLNRDVAKSTETLEASLRLDTGLHASRYFLALGRLAQGRVADARTLLRQIPSGDPYAEAAGKLLSTLPPGEAGR